MAEWLRPNWWVWDLKLTLHVQWRMEERGLSEIALRRLLDIAQRIKHGRVPGRFEVTGRFHDRTWTVVLEPDFEREVIVVVTVFPTR